jgi:hypothetical protein
MFSVIESQRNSDLRTQKRSFSDAAGRGQPQIALAEGEFAKLYTV